MKKGIIFFDIDGTIMDEWGYIPPSATGAIHAAQARGLKCIVNTGRPYVHIEPAVVDIGFDGYICSCGQLLMLSGEQIFRACPDKKICAEIVRLAAECRLDAYYEAEESMRQLLMHEPNPGMKLYLERMIQRGFDVTRDPREDGYCFDKFCIWAHEDSDMERFSDHAGRFYTLIDRGGGMYECVLKGYSKQTGIQAVCRQLGICAEDCYAIGDSANDLPMLLGVGHSIAMGNAPENVKSCVEYVTETLSRDGLAAALEHFDLV